MSHENVEVSEFEIIGGDRVEGLTPDILMELHSIGRHYGISDPSGMILQYFTPASLGIDGEFVILTGVAEDSRRMVVGTSFLVRNPLKVKTASEEIWWARELTVEKAIEQVNKINARAADIGAYDPVTRARLEHHVPPPEEKLSVEKFFDRPGHVISVNGGSAIEALGQFDHPEDLVVREAVVGRGFLITRKADAGKLELSQRIIMELLREKGIDSARPIAIPYEEANAIRKEAERRMAQILKKQTSE